MDSRGRIRAIERVPLSAASELRLETFTIPFPGKARSRTSAYLEDGILYVFGGHVTRRAHDFSPEAFGDEVWSLHLSDLGWTQRASTPAPRQSMGLIRSPEGSALLAVGPLARAALALLLLLEALGWLRLFRVQAARALGSTSAHARFDRYIQ